MLSLVLTLVACTGDDEGYSPFVTIEAPVEGESFRDDAPTVLSGFALDGDSEEEELIGTFSIDGEPLCEDLEVDEDGLVSCEALIPEGDHTITLTAVDPEGHEGSAEVAVVGLHDYPPTVTISEPVEAQAIYAEAALVLSGLVIDDFDPAADLDTWWESDVAGGLGITGAPEDDGAVSTTVTLSEGDHLLTLYAEDTIGGVGSASVSVTVSPANTAPSCEITAPEEGTSAAPGATVTFLATVGDADEDPDLLSISWVSSLDQEIGNDGPSAGGEAALSSTSLSQGLHEITLTVTDDGALSCTDTVSITIGLPPVLTLLSPTEGELLHDVAGVNLQATALDEDGLSTDIILVWTSDLDGEVAVGAAAADGSVNITVEGLTAGAQTLTVVATDSDALTDTAVVSFDINAGPSKPIVEITPDPAYTRDDLVAVITTESEDPEGSEVYYNWEWFLDGGTTAMSTTDTLEHAITSKDDVWQVVVTPHDGLTEGESTSAKITLSNTPPTLGTVTLSPDPGYMGATLNCGVDETADDDGDTVGLTYDWLVSGTALAINDALLTGEYFTVGDVVQCRITPDDGYQAGATGESNEVTIANLLPEIASVTITPESPYADDVLACAYAGFSDADGDADQSTLSWTIAGTEVGTNAELSGVFVRDDEVTCTVTPNDGSDDGTPVSDAVTVLNTPPEIGAAEITPSSAQAGDTLSCTSVDFSDLDGDADQSTVQWSVNGSLVGTSDTLTTGFSGGDVVACDLTAHDGTDGGDTVQTSLTIANTTPSITSVTVAPNPATADDTLVCGWSGFTDPDVSDSDVSTATWSVNGVDVATGTSLDGVFRGGDTVTCSVTPSDGEDQGTPVTDSVVIDNSAPSIASVGILPSVATASDTLVCQYTGYSDADGDADASTYAWSVNGSLVGTTDSLAGVFVGGDTVSCEVTPHDGTSDGTALTVSLLVDNSPPVLADVTVTPDPASTDDSLSCAPGTTSDDDGTTAFTYAYLWSVNGSTVGADATLDSGEYVRDDEVVCLVTPHDGTDEGDGVSSSILTISNTAPEVLSVSLSPTSPSTEDTLSVTATTSDLDGDSVSLSYAWSVDGSDTGDTGSTLSGLTAFDKGQSVTVTVTPDDGTDAGSALTATAVTVANAAPGEPTVAITPTSPYGGLDDLVCLVDNDADDPDGDPLTYTMSWTVDGVTYSDATSTTWTGDTVPAEDTFGGELWECTAVPNDGDEDGLPGTIAVSLDTCTSVDFDGASSYGTVSDTTDLRFSGGNFTIEAWFRLDSLGNDDVHLLSKRDGTSGWDGWVLGVAGSDNALGSGKVFFARSETEEIASSTSISAGAWVHVAFVNDPTAGEVRIYLDGTEEDSGSMFAPGSTTTDLVLGRDSAASDQWLDGQISEVRLSNGVQYSGNFTPDDEGEISPQSVLFYTFDEGTGTSLGDSTGTGNDATLSNASWITSCNFE